MASAGVQVVEKELSMNLRAVWGSRRNVPSTPIIVDIRRMGGIGE